MAIIEQCHPWVDEFKVGRLNYHDFNQVDLKTFAADAVALLEDLGQAYYIKKDLACYL
ncbi:hypothetical protein ACFL9T_01745 [Thermodesulfobacteriota bacterium]